MSDANGAVWLLAKVTAPAEGGRANEALCGLLAKSLGVSPSAVTLLGGHSARWKRLAVRGEPSRLMSAARALSEAS